MQALQIVICGAGEVGSHAADVLVKDKANSITVIDKDPSRLSAIEEWLDGATLEGNCARADVLLEAGIANADAIVAATECDEVNLLTATMARKLGVGKAIARVHDFDYLDRQAEIDYAKTLEIDQLICPEFSTSMEIAQTLRNPIAQKVEAFARGQIQMQQFRIGKKCGVLGCAIQDMNLPAGSRIAAIFRQGEVQIPEPNSTLELDDEVVLVADASVYDAAQKILAASDHRRRSVVILGGSPMAEWLCQMLRGKPFSIRLYEKDRERAEELAADLDWITVLNADLSDPAVFDSEQISDVDDFVALLPEDELNMMAGVMAKLKGVSKSIVVTQRSSYCAAALAIGVDRAFSPQEVAARQINDALSTSPMRVMSSLKGGEVSVFMVRVGKRSKVIGQRLKDLNLTPNWSILAMQRGDVTSFPLANADIGAGDVILVLGWTDRQEALAELFDAH